MSCTRENYTIKTINGVRIVNNKNIPNAPDMELKLKKLYEISTDSISHSCDLNMKLFNFDSMGNFYILDFMKTKVYKYDENGSFVKSFCRKGEGPGEASLIKFLDIENDKIMLFDVNKDAFIMFDTDGAFIGNRNIEGKRAEYVKYNNNFTGSVISDWIGEGSSQSFNKTLVMENLKTSLIDTIYNFSCKYNEKYETYKRNFSYTITDDYVYFSKPDENLFDISMFDENGILLKIYKSHKKLKPSDNHVKNVKKFSKRGGFNPVVNALPPVNNIFIDKYKNIWCMTRDFQSSDTTFQDSSVYDVFNFDGIFLKRLVRDKRWFNPFVGNKYIEYDEENRKIIVNDYEIKGI